MKTIIMTGGGSSGHVTPNIALIPRLKKLGYDIHYIGTKEGIERQLIERENIPYHTISAGKLRRYFDVKNFTDILRVMNGFRQALSIMRKVKPDVVFSKGGFVSCPVVWAAWARKVPVVIHESDMTPGLTNKLSIPFASKICYTFPETESHMPAGKAFLTGIPIRENLLRGDRQLGKKLCGFNDSRPVLMVIGGSLGSESINKALRNSLDILLKDFQICHICGKGNIDPQLKGLKGYKQFEYVNEEQPHIFAMADMVVSRAGATVLFELLELKKPNLLIPLSKRASRGDQILNAQSFEKQGFSQVLQEENLNKNTFVSGILNVYRNRSRYMEAMASSRTGNAADTIVRLLVECTKSK